jgi:hypothetical protein
LKRHSWKGFNILDFTPAARIAYNFSQIWAVAVEEYADYGPIKHFLSADQQLRQLFGVIDYKGEPFNVEAGLGFGLTAGSDRLVAKIMLGTVWSRSRWLGSSRALHSVALGGLAEAGSSRMSSFPGPPPQRRRRGDTGVTR